MALKKIVPLSILLLFLIPVRAAEAPAVPPAPDTENITTPTQQAEPISGNDAVATAEEEATAEDEESSTRFIPTEQISQDLGVSFPVDI